MIELKPDWKFSDIQDNVEVIKSQYMESLSPFSYFQMREKIEKIREIKRQIMGYENIENWQRERLWETINGDFEIEEFRRLCK